jgi:DNA-binding LacI/PurR family transcriptional regulator
MSRRAAPSESEVRRIGIHDVARWAGVSTATASQALNGKGRVSADTQKRIMAAADRLGYRANKSAVSLRTGRNNLLAIQIGRSGHKGVLMPSATYFSEILNGVSTEAFRRGWTPVFLPRDVTGDDIRKLNPDCGVVVDPQGDESLLQVLIEAGKPVLTTGRVLKQDAFPELLSIDNDAVAAVTGALDHLAAAGYRRPALVVSQSNASYVADALVAADAWSRKRGLSVPIVRVRRVTSERVAGTVRGLLESGHRPDAIYATDEGGALGSLRAARALGLDVPEQLGIVCGLDGPTLSESWPPITAIDLKPGVVGRAAARELIQFVEDAVAPPRRTIVRFSIKERRSTGRQT